MKEFLSVLPDIANSPLAIVAYILVLSAFVYIKVGKQRDKTFFEALEKIPEDKKPEFIKNAGYKYTIVAQLPKKDRIKAYSKRYLFLGFAVAVIAFSLILISAILAFSGNIQLQSKLNEITNTTEKLKKENEKIKQDRAVLLTSLEGSAAWTRSMAGDIPKIRDLQEHLSSLLANFEYSGERSGLDKVTQLQIKISELVLANSQLSTLSTNWIRKSLEYGLLTEQTYKLAVMMLKEAIDDKKLSASLEQIEEVNYFNKPAAIILDVDQTVLEDSIYHVETRYYSPSSWNDYIQSERSQAVPGALNFVKKAREMNVEVFYSTNRNESQKHATLNNLNKLGFNVSPNRLLVRNNNQFQVGREILHRKIVGEDYRILLLVGDSNRNFFIEKFDDQLIQSDFIGTRWIILPNPMYGTW